MQVYRIKTAYDESHNSPWDALWYDGDDEDLDALDCQMRLGAVWKSPPIRLEKRDQEPDVYVFHLYFAVCERVRALLLPVVQDAAEFLPLSTDTPKSLFVLHPLLRADLDDQAIVSRGGVSGNISVIRKYSFDLRELEEAMPVFQVRMPVGSAARDGGYPCSGVLVSQEIAELFQRNAIRGVVCERVFYSLGK